MNDFQQYILWMFRNSLLLFIPAGVIFLAFLFTAYKIHKKKYQGAKKFPWSKILLWFFFLMYTFIVLYATLLRSSGGGRPWNIHLFRAWREAWNCFSAKNWANVFLNVAMFVPLGLFLPLISNRFQKWSTTIALGFLASLGIELLQLAMGTGVCDVDDLFTNTLGSAFGYFLMMALLSIRLDTGARHKPFLVNLGIVLAILLPIISIFPVYQIQEFGNLPSAPAYKNHTGNTKWVLGCELPATTDFAPVFKTASRSKNDCTAFARKIAELEGASIDIITYYEDFAYYNLTEETDSGYLLVSYYDNGFEYSNAGLWEPSSESAD